MRKLFLLTEFFPYGKAEKSFIIPELTYLKEHYKITILSFATPKDKMNKTLETELSEEIDVKSLKNFVSPVKRLFLLIMAHLHSDLWKEYGQILHDKKNVIGRMCEAALFYSMGLYYYYQLRKMYKGFEEGTIFYSYWYFSKTLSLVLLKRKYPNIRIVTRAHGYDLYNERMPCGRQPFKTMMSKELDGIFFVSEKGCSYYQDAFLHAGTLPTLHICRLGVFRKNKKNLLNHSGVFELVSCSNVISLKRVELIVEALSELEGNKVHWTHFGDGNCMNTIRQLAEKLLDPKENITYSLLGHVSNPEVMRYYEENPVDCFISTSSTEGGCPVSIQEALSYGIPVIATDVGGIPETVDGNGILISGNPSIQEIVKALQCMIELNREDKSLLRDKSYQIWSEKFDADKNYKAFVKELMEL